MSIGVGLGLALASADAAALGFGKTVHASFLGQPLVFAVPLRFEADEFVASECVTVEVQAGEDRLPAGQVQHTLDGGGGVERMLRITTSALIEEPVVTVSVSVGCPVRVARKFVLFVDPPAVNLAQVTPAVTPAVGGPVAAQSTTPSPALAEPSAASPVMADASPAAAAATQPAPVAAPRASERSRRPTPPERRRALARPASPPAPTPAPAVAVEDVGRAAVAPRPGASLPSAPPLARVAIAAAPRLKLDSASVALPTGAASAASSEAAASTLSIGSAASSAADAASASASSVADSRAAESAERLQAMEQSLVQLKAEGEATRQKLAAVQARLDQTESRSFGNSVVYTLLALLALLAGAVATLMWQLRRSDRERAQWWAAAGAGPVGMASGAATAGDEASFHDRIGADASASPVTLPGADPEVRALPVFEDSQAHAHHDAPAAVGAASSAQRPLSAEELVDLEQQADFFVTLGQESSAIDLLEGHLHEGVTPSPLPYLKLLELYRAVDDRVAYESAAARLAQQFGHIAPPWGDTASTERGLELHDDVVHRLQAVWPTPPGAVALLESLLFGVAEGHARELELAAYRDVLFLYDVARQLSEPASTSARPDTGGWAGASLADAPPRLSRLPAAVPRGSDEDPAVDLLLPMDDESTMPAAFRSIALLPSSSALMPLTAVDVDLNEPVEPVEHPARPA